MSDEEKKAIDELKEEINKPVEVQGNKFNTFILYNIESAKTILNLIEKQSKEIEEYKKQLDLDNADKKWEDKIKAKIEELDIEIQCCEYADDDLEEYKQDMEKEKARLLRDKAILQSLLEKE